MHLCIFVADIIMTVDCSIIEHSVSETNFTLFHANWIPSSPRIVVCGSKLTGEGLLKVYSLTSKVCTEETLEYFSNSEIIDPGLDRSEQLQEAEGCPLRLL